ncbi:MAG: ABC transporter ATP-binding protein [Planctomycetota bacterium]|nr:ABC transporter ATP-binding protein [Planctomycetota bacterium]
MIDHLRPLPEPVPGHADSVIEIRDIEKVYVLEGGPVHALKGITFTVRNGEFVSIMGQSGSGKSTLLHVLGCLHKASAGLFLLDGVDIAELDDGQLSRIRNEKIGMVFQKFNLLTQEDIVHNVALPLVYAGVPRNLRNDLAQRTLELVGLGDRLHHKPTELSGGQSQRVAIARALVTEPALLLADEPTGNLDSRTGEEIMGVFQALHRTGRTIVQVTHDREKAEYSQKIVHLKDGLIERIEVVERPRQAPIVKLGESAE